MESRHPQYLSDLNEIRKIKARGITGDLPTQRDIPAIAALMIRYRFMPRTNPICLELSETMRIWGMDSDALNMAARGIWNAGYRPDSFDDNDEPPKVGSHFDTQDNG